MSVRDDLRKETCSQGICHRGDGGLRLRAHSLWSRGVRGTRTHGGDGPKTSVGAANPRSARRTRRVCRGWLSCPPQRWCSPPSRRARASRPSVRRAMLGRASRISRRAPRAAGARFARQFAGRRRARPAARCDPRCRGAPFRRRRTRRSRSCRRRTRWRPYGRLVGGFVWGFGRVERRGLVGNV